MGWKAWVPGWSRGRKGQVWAKGSRVSSVHLLSQGLQRQISPWHLVWSQRESAASQAAVSADLTTVQACYNIPLVLRQRVPGCRRPLSLACRTFAFSSRPIKRLLHPPLHPTNVQCLQTMPRKILGIQEMTSEQNKQKPLQS